MTRSEINRGLKRLDQMAILAASKTPQAARKSKTKADKNRGNIACIWFGRNRLLAAQEKATKRGKSLSEFIRELVEKA